MNLYFLVEGKRTEKKVYASWLAHAFPELKLVQRPEDMTENCFRVITGGGYPRYLELVKDVLAEITTVVGNRVDRLFVCIDAEEAGYEARFRELTTWVDRQGPQVRYSVIVQNCCIETWLLGNQRFLKRNPQDEELRELKNHYDVGVLDPEKMGSRPPYRTKAQFHDVYLKAMFRERGRSYSKKYPGPATDLPYLLSLVRRYDDTRHLESFGNLIADWRDLGARIEGLTEDDLT